MESTLNFINYEDIPESHKKIIIKKWEDNLKINHIDMGINEPFEWQFSNNIEKMLFNCIFYRTVQTPHIYFWSIINKV